MVCHVKGSGGDFALVISIGKLPSMKEKAHELWDTSSLSTAKYREIGGKSGFFSKTPEKLYKFTTLQQYLPSFVMHY